MKNVVINQWIRYVFTEQQLRGYWGRLGENSSFDSLTNEQLIMLAFHMYSRSSIRAKEQHILGHGWRTEEDVEGKIIAEERFHPDLYFQVIDTSQEGPKIQTLTNQAVAVMCNECEFHFYMDHTKVNLQSLACPSCSGSLDTVKAGQSFRPSVV